MPRKDWSAGHHGVRQRFGDGETVSSDRKAAVTFAIVIPVLLAVGVVALVAAGSTNTGKPGKQSLTAACASPSAAASASAAPASAGASGSASPSAAATASAAPASAAASGSASPSAAATASAAPASAAPSGSASPSAAATASAAPASAAPSGSASPSAAAQASAAPCPSATATTSTPAAVAAANVNCDIIVPANPLSAQGMATPYQLTGPNGMTPAQSGCTMANAAALGAFVQATIVNTQTGQLSVYDPLVITQGTTPAVAPTAPTLPRNYVATIDFGFNGTVLTQVGATANALRQGNCVNGQAGSPFGQVSFCNGTNFFNEAFFLERRGKLTVPATGTSAKIIASGGQLGTGTTCPTTRNFDMIDQDQSDNVTSVYLLNPATGQTAQNTTANAGNMAGATTLANGSDNILVDAFLDPTLGCTPFMAQDLANNNQPTTSQALDELAAAKNTPAITALVPENDEMTLDAQGQFDVTKTNLYRSNVGQPPVNAANNKTSSPAMYCQNMVNIQTPFLAANQTLLATGATPVPGTGNNLLTFMANRLSMSFTNLGCQNFGLTDPVTVTLDGNGAAVAATFSTTTQTVTNTTGTPPPTATATPSAKTTAAPPRGHRRGRPHHRLMNPSGM